MMTEDMESFPVTFGLSDASSVHDPNGHVTNASVL
jgi:hypothetical protein